MSSNVTYETADDIASVLPIFPLSGALLLPRGQMPLNIFEPRYMAMIDTAMSTHRLIGMVQPEIEGDNPRMQSKLYTVGCAGRITQLAESGDGRYIVTLSGICRFKVLSELSVLTPYRQCQVDYTPFAIDLKPRAGEDAVDRKALLVTLKAFAEQNDMPIDWDSVNRSEERRVGKEC